MYLAMPFDGGKVIDFDEAVGNSTLLGASQLRNAKVSGNAYILNENTAALFAKEGRLYLQINAQKWWFNSEEIELFYSHNLHDKTTEFRVKSATDDIIITKPAWWADIPDFEPFEPEMDEDEDYFGYIYAMFSVPSAQAHILKAWG